MVSHILYHITDGVALLTLNRPEVMNAFSDPMREQLLERLQQAEGDAAVRCVMITGAGKAFCAGGDVANMVALQERNDSSVIRQRMTLGAAIVRLLRRMSKPVVAAVNGAAAGAGMNLALACDLRLCSDQARFAQSFVKIGLVPDWGGFYLLTRVVGTGKALELMMTGDLIDAEEALRLGIVNRVFAQAVFHTETLNFARQLAAGPPATLARIKQGVYLGSVATLEEVLAYEQEAQSAVFLSADAKEGTRAFLEKRPPRFGRD
ncbi:MAG: enoyl-CoA hydratase-related protein [Candidatus Binatia bacterium]|nr:enoyl-CoA hydratase-related protein [Candidatus Binatia bacterium]